MEGMFHSCRVSRRFRKLTSISLKTIDLIRFSTYHIHGTPDFSYPNSVAMCLLKDRCAVQMLYRISHVHCFVHCSSCRFRNHIQKGVNDGPTTDRIGPSDLRYPDLGGQSYDILALKQTSQEISCLNRIILRIVLTPKF